MVIGKIRRKCQLFDGICSVGAISRFGVEPYKNSGEQGFGTVFKPWFCSLTYQEPHDEALGQLDLYSLKHKGVGTKFSPKMVVISDVTATIFDIDNWFITYQYHYFVLWQENDFGII